MRPDVALDLSGPTWRIETYTPNNTSGEGRTRTVSVGPGLVFAGEGDPLGAMQDASVPLERVPIAITPATVEATSLGIGDVADLGAFGTRIPVRVAAITPVTPSVPGAEGIWLDSTTLSRVMSQRATPLGGPSELWLGVDGDPRAARGAVADLDAVSSVTAASVQTDGPAQVAASALWLASGCAMALAVAGLAASAATTLRTRRAEVAVLRAIGMTPRAQARSRAFESGGVLAQASVLGVAGGWVTGLAVGVPVALTATQAHPSFDISLRFDAPLWVALLVAGAASASVIVAWQARTVRRQGLDSTYREEVR